MGQKVLPVVADRVIADVAKFCVHLDDHVTAREPLMPLVE
jgi:hypothetical protein